MNTPEAYGNLESSWFHYLAVIIIFSLTIIFTKSQKNGTTKKFKKWLIVFTIIIFIFEIYKQIIFLYDNDWQYPWYIFPFQFCSIPLYLFPLYLLSKKETTQNAILTFIATYSLFAGLAVLVYPGDVFTETIGINIQTMIHHGTMVIVGVAALVYKIKITRFAFINSSLIFVVILLIASFLNYLHNNFIMEGTFNMFFINPIYENHLPILQNIQPHVSPLIFIVIYTLGFTLVALLIYSLRIIKIKERKVKLEDRFIFN